MAAVWYDDQIVEGYNICDLHVVRMVSRSGDRFTYHTNTSTKGVWREVVPKLPLHNAGVAMRASDTAGIHIQKCERGRGSGKHVPPDNSDLRSLPLLLGLVNVRHALMMQGKLGFMDRERGGTVNLSKVELSIFF